MRPTLESMHLYPVKACRRVDTATANVEPWGLAGDRRWMVTDPEDGRRRLSQREIPRLALIRPEYDPDGRLRLSAPGIPDDLILDPPIRTRGADESVVTVGRFTGPAAAAGKAADAWLSAFLDRSVHLVHMDDTSVRNPNPDYSLPGDRVSFADAYPMLLTTTASLDALNASIEETGAEPAVPMTRFRPNFVVKGTAPWAEEGWTRVRLGSQHFRIAKRCDRCVVTVVDQERGERAGQQPLKALMKTRREANECYFGMFLVPDSVGTVHVGDELEVLD
jgi:uncharacterized protein YcbX